MNDLQRYSESAVSAVLERAGRGVSQMQKHKSPAHGLFEPEDAYLVVFDTPGTRTEGVQVRFLDGKVEICIDRFRGFHEGYEIYFPGHDLTLSRMATVPSNAPVETAKGTATVSKYGTLQIRIPKDERTSDIAVIEEKDEADGKADIESDDKVDFDDVDDQDA